MRAVIRVVVGVAYQVRINEVMQLVPLLASMRWGESMAESMKIGLPQRDLPLASSRQIE
jgi:hypothetical protein